MKKRLAAFLLLLSMLPAGIGYAETNDTTFSNDLDMLSAFGIIETDGGEQSDAYVTRGDFAKYLACAMNLMPYDKTEFIDVDNDYLEAISALEKNSVVLGNGIEYKPNDIITNQDAAVMIMRALGYTKAAEFAGGYPSGYLSYAASVGVTSGIKINEYARMDTIAKMLCNMLEADIYVMNITSGNSYSYEKGETFMERYYDAYKITGVLQGNNNVNINGLPTNKDKNTVIFEYQNYLTAIDLSDYIGCKLTVYYTSIDSENTIIFAKEHKNNTITTISGYDIEELDKDNFNLTYDVNGKNKNLKFYNGTNFILNSEYVTDIENTDLNPDDGEIRAIDNNGDGKIDVFFVTKNDYLIVKNFSINDEFIVDKITGEKIGLELEELVITKDGEAVNTDRITVNSLLEIIKSFDGKIKEIKVFDSNTGIIKSSSEDEINIDGESLGVSDFYREKKSLGKKVKIGNTVTYYKNGAERVIWIDEDMKTERYGYLISIFTDEDTERDVFKLLTSDGTIEKIPAAEKVTFNDIKINGSGIKAREEFTNDVTGVSRQLLKYTKNSRGEINKLYTARDTLEDAVNKGADREFTASYGDIEAIFANKDKFSLDYYTTTETIRHVKGQFNSTYGINANTVIYNVPEPGTIDVQDDDYYLGTMSQFAGDKKYGNLYFYDFDETLNASVLVNYRAKTEKIDEKLYFLVDSVKYAVDENDEVRACVSGYSNGKYVEFMGKDIDYLSQKSEWGSLNNKDYSNIGWNDLKKGDILFYSLDHENRITAYSLCAHDVAALNTDYFIGGYSNLAVIDGRDGYGGTQFCTGTVTGVEDGYFFVNTKTTKGIDVIRRLQSAGDIYSLKNNKLYESDFNDLAKSDRVAVMCRYDVPAITIIIKD